MQDAIIESPRRTKNPKTLHHLSRSDLGDVIASIATSVPDVEGERPISPRYQVSQVKLGKQTKWGEMASLDVVTFTIKIRIEKEHRSKKEVKAQLQQYK